MFRRYKIKYIKYFYYGIFWSYFIVFIFVFKFELLLLEREIIFKYN